MGVHPGQKPAQVLAQELGEELTQELARLVWRKKAMTELDSWAAEHELPPEPFARMKQAVIALFADMERKGEFGESGVSRRALTSVRGST
jgi:hypothetical protein